jgi:5-formyltetrahydrofolate cyclo-ligase
MLVCERKAHLRRTERNRWRRGANDPASDRKSLSAQENLLSAFPPGRGCSIALYSAVGMEVRTERIRAACLAAGALVYYPRVMEDDRLAFFLDDGETEWVKGRYGLLEPKVPPGSEGKRQGFDLVVVPGMAFDTAGRRLGRGSGYYDRFLAGLEPSAATVGLAFSCQLVSEVPVDPWDIPVQAVATEDGVLRIAAARPSGPSDEMTCRGGIP